MTDDVPGRLSLDRHEATDLLFAAKEGIRLSATGSHGRFERLMALYVKTAAWLAAGEAAHKPTKRKSPAKAKRTGPVPRAVPLEQVIAEELPSVAEYEEAGDTFLEEEPEEEPKAPPPEPTQEVSLPTALKWYVAREGRSVKAMGGGAFQIEARDDILNIRQLMSIINQARRRADQPKFELKE